ncbi:hypothetical protein BDW60DRAFT_193977, partial [Aspergillus nidulans var. acristatus]
MMPRYREESSASLLVCPIFSSSSSQLSPIPHASREQWRPQSLNQTETSPSVDGEVSLSPSKTTALASPVFVARYSHPAVVGLARDHPGSFCIFCDLAHQRGEKWPPQPDNDCLDKLALFT